MGACYLLFSCSAPTQKPTFDAFTVNASVSDQGMRHRIVSAVYGIQCIDRRLLWNDVLLSNIIPGINNDVVNTR